MRKASQHATAVIPWICVMIGGAMIQLSVASQPAAIQVVNSALPSGVIGVGYRAVLYASGGLDPYTWAVQASILPPGLQLSAGGVLSGTPTSTGNYSITLRATDANGKYGSQSYSLTISTLGVTTTSLPSGVEGIVYQNTVLSATGGNTPYSWATASGSSGKLPSGLSLSSAGLLSGTPSAVGYQEFTVKATSANGQRFSQTLAINTVMPLTLSGSALPPGTIGRSYKTSMAASGGKAPYQWKLVAGAPPSVIGVDSTGSVAGTPTVTGSYGFTVQVSDASGQQATGQTSIAITGPLAITTASLPNGKVGTSYSAITGATGGLAPYTWKIAGGALPAGLSLSSGGGISGIPTTAGSSNFTLQATDSGGGTTSLSYTVSIVAGLGILTTSLPNGTVGTPYNTSVSATGGTSPYAWTVSAGALPAGLALNGGGGISGTPSVAGSPTFTLKVTDSVGGTSSLAYTVSIAAGVVITTTSLPSGTTGVAYSATLAAIGGTAPYTWSIASGLLPTGVGLGVTTGTISGTPSTAGTYNVTMAATDATGRQALKVLSLVIAAGVCTTSCSTLTITTTSLPGSTVGVAYSATLAATGGTAPFTWSILSGQLPPGITLASSSGIISGTPSSAGSYTFVVQAADSAAHTTSQSYTMTTLAVVSLDQYGGVTSLSCSNGPQVQFYTQKMGNRWYLCTPDGHAFFFQGVSHIDYNAVVTDGGYSYQSIIQNKFASDPQAWQYGWADTTLARIKSWGFNSVGDSSNIYVWPWGSGGSRIPATKLPVIPSTAMSYYSFTNNGNYAPAPTKSLIDALTGSAYTGWVGRGLPDVYDPVYDAYVNGRNAGTLGDAYWSKTFTSPWSLGFVVDESDDVFGLNGPGPEAPNPPDGAYHPHVGWITLAVSPTKTNSSKWGVTYSDPTVYSKLQLRMFLDGATYPGTGKYATIAALNASWGSNYTTFGSAGGWPKATTHGTGLMDEDGSSPWLGDTAGMLYNATPGVVADLDTFLLQWARKYFSLQRTRFKQYSPKQLMFCPMLNNHDGLTRRQVLQAAGEYCDVIQAGADTQALLDKTALYAGDHPIMHGFVGTPANPDSALWKYASPVASPAATQVQRGTYYNTAATALWSNFVTATGAKPVVGFTFWEWSDNWNDNGSKINWGLVTARDNAYDGREAVSTPNIQCQAPQQTYNTCGGEDSSFGNFIDAVQSTNLAIWKALATGQ